MAFKLNNNSKALIIYSYEGFVKKGNAKIFPTPNDFIYKTN